jgi:hypothetical protein
LTHQSDGPKWGNHQSYGSAAVIHKSDGPWESGGPRDNQFCSFPEHQSDRVGWWPKNVSSIIKDIVSREDTQPNQSPFLFELTSKAAHKNFCVLKKFNFSLKATIKSAENSPISYGSEFRAPSILSRLLSLHPRWQFFKNLLDNGSSWPLSEISEEHRRADVEEALNFGNHKGASLNNLLLKSLIEEDVTHGFILPLPLEKIKRIPGVLLAPLNIMHQNTINKDGVIIEKERLTHDQSFVYHGSNTSVNSRTDKSKLEPCVFGWVIKRLINWIVAARRKHPNC